MQIKRTFRITWTHIISLSLIVLIIFVQFQNILGVPLKDRMPQLSHAIFLSDKLFIMALFVTVVFARFLIGCAIAKEKRNQGAGYFSLLKSEAILASSLFIFVLWCLVSATVNQNNLIVSLNGIFVYILYFLFFFVFSGFPWPTNTIRRIYFILLRIALALSVVSICQEIIALVYLHSVEWWPNIMTGESRWRLGIFRAPSLLGHPNNIGIFALFFLTIELARKNEKGVKNNFILFILISTILFTMSRAAIGASMIAMFLLLRMSRKIAIVFLVSILIIGYSMGVSSLNITALGKGHNTESFKEMFSSDNYRNYACQVSLDVIKDHLVFGVGPGMYGGHISLKYDSPIYQEYGFTGQYYDYLHDHVGSIEQEILQVLAEVGVPGFIFFCLVLFAPFFILSRIAKRTDDTSTKSIITGLKVMPFLMFFYMWGYTMSQTQEWLIPYFVFVGMIVGNQRRNRILA